jgi:tetratricopeptide (TPR) repeat protein
MVAALMVFAAAAIVSAQEPAGDDYATERAKAVNLGKDQKWLVALPLFADLAAKTPNDINVLEGLAQGLIARAATLTDPEAAGKDRIQARTILQKAQKLGDRSALVANLLDDLNKLPANGDLNFNENAETNAALKAGEAAFARQDFEEAIKNYSHALELDPTSYPAALFVGDSYFAEKKFPQAAEWYDRAAKINPNIETAYRYHADMLTKRGDFSGARTLGIEAIVAEPYNNTPWRGLAAWANSSHVRLTPGKIRTGCTITPSGEAKVNVVIAPDQEPDAIAVWTAYCAVRAGWYDHDFRAKFPNESTYRHSMPEEAAALTVAARTAEGILQKTPDSPIAKDPDIQLLLRVYRELLIEPYVLISGADREIARDYVAFRAQNRDEILKYLSDFIVPEPPKTP